MYDPKEVLGICEKATPGPWDFDEDIWWKNTPGEQEKHGGLIVYPLANEDLTVAEVNHYFDRKQGNANAQFISLARTALPEFAEEVIKLRAVADAATRILTTKTDNDGWIKLNAELRQALIAAGYGGDNSDSI